MRKFTFYALKVPAMLVLMCLGYLLDFIFQLPFLAMWVAAGRGPSTPVVRERRPD